MCLCSVVKTYDVAQDSTIGQKKRKIEELDEADESKPKKAKLIEVLTPATPGSFYGIFIVSCTERYSSRASIFVILVMRLWKTVTSVENLKE
jgi:hypothetical protein